MKTNINLRQIAIAAFVVGVVLHACVVLSVVGGGSDSGDNGTRTNITSSQQVKPGATATATRLPDRTTCAEIRGTDYRSDTERDWFRANCSGGAAQPIVMQPRFS